MEFAVQRAFHCIALFHSFCRTHAISFVCFLVNLSLDTVRNRELIMCTLFVLISSINQFSHFGIYDLLIEFDFIINLNGS